MKITDIRLRLGKGSEEGGKLKAYVDITFDDSFDSEDRSNELQNELTDSVVAFIE